MMLSGPALRVTIFIERIVEVIRYVATPKNTIAP
jgi:hypothetical protein